jgi:hypothetical protein
MKGSGAVGCVLSCMLSCLPVAMVPLLTNGGLRTCFGLREGGRDWLQRDMRQRGMLQRGMGGGGGVVPPVSCINSKPASLMTMAASWPHGIFNPWAQVD